MGFSSAFNPTPTLLLLLLLLLLSLFAPPPPQISPPLLSFFFLGQDFWVFGGHWPLFFPFSPKVREEKGLFGKASGKKTVVGLIRGGERGEREREREPT